jgi:cell division protein FtsQ
MKNQRVFWTPRRNKKKKLHLLLDASVNRKKKKEPVLSPGFLSKLIIAGIFVVVIGAAALFLSRSVLAFFVEDPKFAVSKIEVSNIRVFAPDEVIALSGLSRGLNIFGVDIFECKKRIEDNPNIVKAELSRLFPDTVRIKVYEREPIAILEIGKNYLVDGESVLLSWDERWNVKELPVITGVEKGTKFLDKKVVSDNLAQGIRLVSLYNLSRLKPVLKLLKVDVSNAEEIVFYTDGDFIVKMSDACGRDTFDRLFVVYENLKSKGNMPAAIDLRFQDVVVTPKHGKDMKTRTAS